MPTRNTCVRVALAFLLCSCYAAAQSPGGTVLTVDASAPAHPFPHFWQKMFGSGRAVLALRDNYREDLRAVKQITGVQYVRFHGILDDDVGIYDEDQGGKPLYNFSYVDQIYDGLLANGVKPFVELSFMPKKLAAKEILHPFWYRPVVAPPKDWAKWDDLISEFTRHLISRYGIGEVSQWYFEVWNEPNLDFWGGSPKQSTYFDLYDHTARALKAVDSCLRVGGPSTAQAAWADAFLRHCAERHVPVDFVSSHVYGNDRAQDVFGTNEEIPRHAMVCRAVRKVHDEIRASSIPNLPLIWSEYNASYKNEHDVTDSAFMGPWIADTIRQCDGLVDIMSYWTFSDVFEEQGVFRIPFYGGYGLIAPYGIPKPAFNAFKLLNRLGDQRLELDSDSALATRRNDGSLVIALWNYAPPDRPGPAKSFTLRFKGMKARSSRISIVGPDRGNYESAYKEMGSPRYPTQAQIRQLVNATVLPPAEERAVNDGKLTITLPSYGLALVEVR